MSEHSFPFSRVIDPRIRSSAEAAHRTCSSCRLEIQGEANFCSVCGTQVPKPPEPRVSGSGGSDSNAPPMPQPGGGALPGGVAPKAEPPLPPTPPHQAAVCGQCQTPLVPDAAYCHLCGHRKGVVLAQFQLVCRSRGGAKKSVAVGASDLVIGSASECDVVIPDDAFVSRQHLRLFAKDGRMHVEDLGSSNGVLLRIRQPTAFEPGDEMVIGTTVLHLESA